MERSDQGLSILSLGRPFRAIAPLIVLVSSCSQLPGLSGDPDLVAVCSRGRDAALVNDLMGEGMVRPPRVNDEFRTVVDDVPHVAGETLEDRTAVGVINMVRAERSGFVDMYQWSVTTHTSSQLVLVGRPEGPVDVQAVIVASRTDDGPWSVDLARHMRCRVEGEGYGRAAQ